MRLLVQHWRVPYPQNLETANELQQTIREAGAVPATIAVLNGRLKIGLDTHELELLSQTQQCLKLSRADLAFALSTGKTGSTTVASTMIAANLADIDYFATGGIGGVHRGAELSMDISADLNELARTDVCVVCAGAKAILDLPLTLEYLETAGVPVVVFKHDQFPAFWSRSSGIPAPIRLNSPRDINALLQTRRQLGMTGGVLIANPIPDNAQIPYATMDKMIQTAIDEAIEQGVTGKAVTPFLLEKINQFSSGKSLKSNIALVKNNAVLAARLAVDAQDTKK